MAQRTVEIPRALLVVLASALGVSFLALAFMLGRETGRDAPADEPAPSNQSASAPAPPPVTSPLPPSTLSSTPPPPVRVPPPTPRPDTGVLPAPQPASPPSRMTPPAASAPTPIPAPASPDNRERAAIERYFNEVEAVSSPGEVGASPDALAQALLSQGTQGDWSSFDKLVRDQRDVLNQLQGISVPAACRTYHTQTVDLVRESIRLLEDVKKGMQSGNLGGLQALSAKAQTLQGAANELAALGTQIKQRHGLVP